MMSNSLDWFKYYTSTLSGIAFKRMKKSKIEGFTDLRDKLEATWTEFLTMAAIVNDEGYLSPNLKIPYCDEDLADYLERDVKEITICLAWFKKQGMMDKNEYGWYIVNWEKYQKRLTDEEKAESHRIAQQKYRERLKGSMADGDSGDNHGDNVTVTSQRVDKDVDVDVDVDKNTNNENQLEESKGDGSPADISDKDIEEATEIAKREWGK